eukprot:g26457.t1
MGISGWAQHLLPIPSCPVRRPSHEEKHPLSIDPIKPFKNPARFNEITSHLLTSRKIGNVEPMDDEDTILRKMRLLSDYYDVHQEIG